MTWLPHAIGWLLVAAAGMLFLQSADKLSPRQVILDSIITTLAFAAAIVILVTA